MSDIINQIADAIEAEIHEAWTESDADFNRGMEYAISIVKAVDMRTDSDTISRQDAIEAFYEPKNGGTYAELDDGSEWYMTSKEIYAVLESLPSAETPTVSKKHQLSEEIPTNTSTNTSTDLISRQAAIAMFEKHCYPITYDKTSREKGMTITGIREVLGELPSAEPRTGKWTDRSDGGRIRYPWWESCECSKCGETASGAYNFCPNCGARMYKGGEE